MSFEDSKKMQYPSSSFSGMDIKSFSENYFSVQESWVTDRHSRKKAGRKGRSSKLYWIKKHYFLFSLFLLFVAAIVALGVYGIITFIETEKRKDPKYQCPEGFVLSDCQRADFQDFLHWEKPIGFIMEDENVYDQGIAFRVLFQYAQNVALYHSSMDNKYAVRSFVRTTNGDSSWFVNVGGLNYNTPFYYNITMNGRSLIRYSLESSALYSFSSTFFVDLISNSTFDWESFHYLPHLDKTQLILYKLHIPSFTTLIDQYGNLDSLTSHLDYLAFLGVNTIVLSPIEPAECDYDNKVLCWKDYTLLFPGKLNPNLGSVSSFKLFVKEAHKRGLSVIIETNWALFSQSTFLVDYFASGVNQGWGNFFEDIITVPAPLHMNHLQTTPGRPGNDYIHKVFRRWQDEFGLDGVYMINLMCQRLANANCMDGTGFEIRAMMDLLANMTANYNMYFLADDSMNVFKKTSSVLDVTKPVAKGGLGFALQRNPYFYSNITASIMLPSISFSSMYSFLDKAFGRFEPTQFIYIEDEMSASTNRFRVELNSTSHDDIDAVRRQMLALYVLFTTPAAPMLFMGTEYFTTMKFDPLVNKLDLYNVGTYENEEWTTVGKYQSYFYYTRDLISLRKQNQALNSNSYYLYYNNPEDQLVAFSRGEGDSLLVTIINYGQKSFLDGTLFIDFPTFASTSIRRYKLVFSSDQKKYDLRFIEISRDALMRDCPPIRSFNYTLCGNIRIAPMTVLTYQPDFSI